MRAELRQLQRQLGITMVYVTHDQVEAMSMADRVVLLNGGKIEQNGTPVELYETPANTFVARFIGTPPMNLMKLEAGDGGAVVAGTAGPVVLPGALVPGMLGVRPEHVALAHGRGLCGTVESVEYLGGDSLVACRVGSERAAVRAMGSVSLARGDPAWLSWAPSAQHYFDASGARAAVPEGRSSATMFA